MKVRLDETLFKARAQENLSMTNDINKLEQVDALVECLDHFVADRKWVNEISRDELLTMVTQSNGDKEVLIESVLAKFNTPCIDTKKLKECKERRQNKGLKESMKTRKSLKESDNRDTFTLDTSTTPILNCGLYYTLLGELDPGRYDKRFKEFEGCVKECAKPILDELVRETPNFEVVSVGNYYHPRYYNYETDSLEFTVKYTGNDLGTVIEEYSNNQDFIDFLQNYKSYDGFISFFADNKDDFVKQDYAKSVSQIIKYNVTEEEYDEANENLYYDVMDCGFYTEDEDDTEESLKEKKYDIYVNDKYVASSDRHKRAKDIEDKIRKDGKIKYAGEKALRTSGVELDELNVGANDKLKIKRARESKENKNLFAYRIYMRDRDKDFSSGKDYKDAKSMLKDAKKDFELANTELRTNPKYLVCMLFDLVDGEYYHYKDLYSAKEIEDEIKLEATPSKKECKAPKRESKKLKEGYYGQTLDDFLGDCMDSSAIDKIYIYGNDDVVYEGTIGGIPDDMRETEFLECDMYTNRKSVVTVNVDSSEEYGYGTYEFLNEFLDDCNCELVVIYDLAEGEEIFSGYKEDIPEEYLEYAFSSYDAPEEMSVNLNDYEGEDDFDESLKESDDKEVEKLDTFDDQMDFLAKDEQEAIDGYKKVINKVRNAKVKTQLKKIETEEKAHKDYLNKVKKNKDLEYTEPLIERKGNKCCKGKCKKANESLNDTQNLIDNAKKFAKENNKDVRVTGLANSNECAISTFPEDFNEMVKLFNTKFDVYDEDSELERFKIKVKSTNESLAQDYYASVLKKFAGRTITEHDLDACAKELGINGYRLWNVLKELAYDKYITKGENYGEEYFKIPSNAYDKLPSALKGNLKEGKIKIKDEIQRLVDKYSRLQKQYHGDSSASKKVEAEIDRLQCLLDMGKEYVDENLKEGGSVDDFLKPMILSDTLERQPFISFAYEDQDGSTVVTTSWETTPRRAHSDYIKTRKFLGDKYNIDVLRQENRDGNKEFAYVMRITHKGK